MKKIFGFLAAISMTVIVACGPSDADKKATKDKETKEADSLAEAGEKMMAAPDAKKDTTKKPEAASADTSKKK